MYIIEENMAIRLRNIKMARTIYNNSKIARKGYKFSKAATRPITEMKDVYIKNKDKGTRKAIKSVFKEKGVCAPILTITGAIAGLPFPIPGTSLAGAAGGYFLGRAIDIFVKALCKKSAKIFKL